MSGQAALGGGRVNLGVGSWRGPDRAVDGAARLAQGAREFQTLNKKEADNYFPNISGGRS